MGNKLAVYANTEDQKAAGLFKFLLEHAPYPLELNPQSKTVQDTTVYIAGYHSTLHNLDQSNKIILLARKSVLGSQDFLLLPMVDTIIAHTQYEAMQIAWQLRCKGFKTRVVHLLPHFKNEQLTKSNIYCPDVGPYGPSLINQQLQNTDPKASIRMCLAEEREIPDYFIKGIISGAVCIALDKPPFNEIIIDRHTGYLIRDAGDFVDVFQHIESSKNWVGHAARTYTNALLNPTKYLDAILTPEKLYNLNNFDKAPKDFNERIWLVRERIFQDGKVLYSPVRYNQDFTLIDLGSVEEVLEYFQTQHFAHVYVFGCDLPEELEDSDETQLHRMITKLGKRALQIHFCRDESIPKAWQKIFQRLSIVSTEEGLKQVTG
jgi:hypothetical protein